MEVNHHFSHYIELPPILVDNVVNCFFGKLGEVSSLDDIIHLILPGDNLFRGRRRKIGAENQLVFHPVFKRRNERLVVPPRTIMECGDVNIQIGMLTN